MFSSQYLRVEEQPHGVKKIILNRSNIKNAFNAQMIADLKTLFVSLAEMNDPTQLRLVILTGEGNVFCSGADLNYMQEQSTKSFDENFDDANILGDMFFHLSSVPCPVITAVKGAAIGGGLGLCACSDYVLVQEKSIFATSEVKLGLIPALIGPYVIRKIGTTHASYLMLTGEKIESDHALKIGLINKVCPEAEFESELNKTINSFLMAEPKAAWQTKKLIQTCSPLPNQMLFEYTANEITLARSSKEGKEGLRYFFEKKRPHWCP